VGDLAERGRVPEGLIFEVNYQGDNMSTFALSFSRPGSRIVGRYYKMLRLGFDGYRRVQAYAREVATRLAAEIEELGPFELLTRGDELPVFAFKLNDDVRNFTVFDVSNAVRERGWQVPAYTFPANRTDVAALRFVVKRGFSHDVADLFLADLKRQLPRLERQREPAVDPYAAAGFRHRGCESAAERHSRHPLGDCAAPNLQGVGSREVRLGERRPARDPLVVGQPAIRRPHSGGEG